MSGDHYSLPHQAAQLKEGLQMFSGDSLHFGALAGFDPSLELHPLLGARQLLAKQIAKENDKLPVAQISSWRYFRARKSNDDSITYTSEDMKEPLVIVITPGRYNHFWQRVLYLSASEQGAIQEIRAGQHPPRYVWIQEFEIKNLDRVLDLKRWKEPRSGIFENGSKDAAEESGYLVGRYVADCAREKGFQAIEYHSSKGALNHLVIFEPNEATVKPIGQPRRISVAA